MPDDVHVHRRIQRAESKDGLRVSAYRGDGAVLLAYDLDADQTKRLAGFAVHCTPPKGAGAYLPNRLNFGTGLVSDDGPEARVWTPSIEAPFQKFRWVDFSGLANPGSYHYEVSAMYFNGRKSLRRGPTVGIDIDVGPFTEGRLSVGFTRSYVSSQAYARRYNNMPLRPPKKSLDYDLKPYRDAYAWLGAHAGRLLFEFMDECVTRKDVLVDVFAYDCDEPTFVRQLEQLGSRLRLFLDNASLHTKTGALERDVERRIKHSTGHTKQAPHVQRGHFQRFAHSKVVIMRDKDTKRAIKVLTGSANFSVRGLYVQANNVLVFNDRAVAEYYARVFDAMFTTPSGFAKNALAKQWFEIERPRVPISAVAFSPHTDPELSLGRVSKAIESARSSVMFAVMETGAKVSGSVMKALRDARKDERLFNYGITQSTAGVTTFGPGRANGVITSFAYLKDKIPEPFREEVSGGSGQVVHHKFVVVDFNGDNPAVFTGSSNLAAGGEKSNGDNLVAIYDREVAVAYGVEAMRLVDHFHFRAAWKKAHSTQPLRLQAETQLDDEKAWWRGYYDRDNPRYLERKRLQVTRQGGG